MVALVDPCRCGKPSDFILSGRSVVPKPYKARRGGLDVVIQPYVTYFRCAECTKAEIASTAPPREARPLPHHAAVLRKQHAEAVKALVGDIHQDRLGDWGHKDQHYPSEAS